MEPYRVLLIGPRRAIIEVLRARRIPFCVWREKESYPIPDTQKVLTAPLFNTTKKLKQVVNEAFANEHFTHVIAGSESAVYPAAIARRIVGARTSPTTTALRCRDKLAMKEYLSEYDIPMTRFMAESAVTTPVDAFDYFGSPIVRKQRNHLTAVGLNCLAANRTWQYSTTDATYWKSSSLHRKPASSRSSTMVRSSSPTPQAIWKSVMSIWCLQHSMKHYRQKC